jgi:hypothetical protein
VAIFFLRHGVWVTPAVVLGRNFFESYCNTGIHPNYLGSMITNYARYTVEIKSSIAMAKAAFNKEKTLFTSKLHLNLRNKLVKCYIRRKTYLCTVM